jgi:hypothetical protein
MISDGVIMRFFDMESKVTFQPYDQEELNYA